LRPSAFSHLLPTTTTPTTKALASSAFPFDAALALARAEAHQGIGRTAPNPPVGCVILDADGVVVAVGHHARAGEAHAEVAALDALIAARGPGAAKGLTAVVTLEPCAHQGRTGPCTTRLIAEGVARVVVGVVDPNPIVCGRGVAALRAAGVDVVVADGVAGDACAALIAPFATAMTRKRAYVVAKTATTLDGKVATHTGASRFITGPQSRALVHGLRDACDAIMVGAATVAVDDPALTARDIVRATGAVRDPRRVILDRLARTPLTARVFDPPGAVVFHAHNATLKPVADVVGVAVEGDEGGLDLDAVAAALAGMHIHSVLVEAGPRLLGALIKARLVDELWWFSAPTVMGADGTSAVAPLGVSDPSDVSAFDAVHRCVVGDDHLTVLRPRL